jgi:hypothetical protein
MISAEYRDIDKRKIAVNDNELSARLGRRCTHTDPELYRVLEALLQIAEPRYGATRVKVSYTEGGTELGFLSTTSTSLVKNLAGATEAFVFVVTLGVEVDRLLNRLSKTSRAEAFIFDAVAYALVEAACDVAEQEIKGTLSTRPRFSPGYGDFSIEHQGALLEFLGAPAHLGICVGEGGIMSPMKTVSAVMGIVG